MWPPLKRDISMEGRNWTLVTEFILVGIPTTRALGSLLFLTFSLAYLVTIFGNSLIITLIFVDYRLHSPMYFFLSNLSFSEVLTTTCAVPKMLAGFLSDRMSISFAGCLIQSYFYFLFGCTEFILFAVMSYDRYVAICSPLQYPMIVTSSLCVRLVILSWVGVVPLYLTILPLCGPYVVDYIFCELPILLHMFCADTSRVETTMAIGGAGTVLFPFLLIILSYLRILVAVMTIDSVKGRKKAFSTCTSHLIVVIMYYGTGLIRYLRPKSLYSAEGDKLISVFYAVINPMVNPFIYSLRNKEVKEGMKKVMGRYKIKTKQQIAD
uniref:G-protein coupled receptors family 1 profile domain-containing protein n=1 Tax=Suricata suricatta TaxID=37032 RepID=A0A673TPV6_SURSU